jgi:hypothetical protein
MKVRRTILALAAVAIAVSAAANATSAPMIVLYAPDETNRTIIKPGTADALPVDGRLHVQEANIGHLFAGEADIPYRVDHASAATLIEKRTGEAMAAYLKGRIDAGACIFSHGRVECGSGLVFVDELDHRFGEKAPNLNTPAWRGRTSRSQPVRKFPNYIPRARSGQPGYELSRAMVILANTPYKDGGNYAQRIHFYIAPGFVTSVGESRGKYFNMGRDRRPHWPSHEGARTALRLSGGVWLEMYHYINRVRYPFHTHEWAKHPARFAKFMTGAGATVADPTLVSKLHFHMSSGMPKNTGLAPAECLNPATPQGCQFALASLPQNQAILANGVGQYRMGVDAHEWRTHVKRIFFPELP